MISGKGQSAISRLATNNTTSYGSTSTTPATKTNGIPNHNLPKPNSTLFNKPEEFYDDRKRFATAFVCWLVGGIFGAHHFYLRGYRTRFTWIYSLTSLISFGTSLLLFSYQIHETFDKACKVDDPMAAQYCTNFFRVAILGGPIWTCIMRWLLEVQRIPRMVQRANAPTSLSDTFDVLNTSDAYSMSFSGICVGAHWLYLRPIPGNTWNHDGSETEINTTTETGHGLWTYGIVRFVLNFITLGGGGIIWIYDLFRMPVHVDKLLGRRRNERHVYRPSALLLVVVGFWCGLHNFYLFGVRSRYAKLYGLSSLMSSLMIGIYLSTVRFVDAGVCYDPFHNHTKIYNNASYDTTYHTATYVLSGSVTDTTGLNNYNNNNMNNINQTNQVMPVHDYGQTWWVFGLCWCWRLFFWVQILAMLIRLFLELIRIGILGLHKDLNSDLQDREDTLARQVSYVNAYLLCLPVGIVGTHRIFLYGMTSTTLLYILTCGGFGFAWIYDVLDIPRLIDDQFTEARRILFHQPNYDNDEDLGNRRQTGSYSSATSSYNGPSPYGPAPPPASWRDHLVEGLAQTLHEASEGSSKSSSQMENEKDNKNNNKKNNNFLNTRVKGSLAGRNNNNNNNSSSSNNSNTSNINNRRRSLESKSVGGERFRSDMVSGSGSGSTKQQSPSGTNGTNVTALSPLRLNNNIFQAKAENQNEKELQKDIQNIAQNAEQDANADIHKTPIKSNVTSSSAAAQALPTLNSMTGASKEINDATTMKTPQRGIREHVDIASSLPPPSTPIHRIVRVHSVKHWHSPTCHPMSESLKASNSLFSSQSSNGRISPQNDDRTRGSSRASDIDFGFRSSFNGNEEFGNDRRSHNRSNTGMSSRSDDVDDFKKSKTLSSIWLIEFELIQLGKKIAAGGSGQLFEARYVGTDVAVKELFTALIDSENIEEFKRETVMLMQLQHPHIVQFYGVSYHDQHYYIVQELCKGSMYDILNPIDQIPGAPIEDYDFNDPKLMITWAAGIARGLAFMHAKSIVHRDLKPQNILIDRSRAGVPKICDFGLSRMYDSMKGRQTKVAGTAAYLAPEVIGMNHAEVATPVDVFAFAVTFWWMLHRTDPYPKLGEPQILMGVFQRGLRPTVSPDCPENIAALIEDCWVEDPTQRPTMVNILERIYTILDSNTYQLLELPLAIPPEEFLNQANSRKESKESKDSNQSE